MQNAQNTIDIPGHQKATGGRFRSIQAPNTKQNAQQ